MNSSSAIARSTTLRRSTARFGLANGERDAGLWMTPAMSAASLMREVGDVLAEEDARRLGDAVDRERAALPEVDVVEIQLEDLVLRGAPLEHERHHAPRAPCASTSARRLLQLGVELVGEEEHPRELLRDRAVADRRSPLSPNTLLISGRDQPERD